MTLHPPLTCSDCNAEIPSGEAITLQGLVLCCEDAAHRATEMLALRRAYRLGVGEIERAASALEVASRLLRERALKGYSGVKRARCAVCGDELPAGERSPCALCRSITATLSAKPEVQP